MSILITLQNFVKLTCPEVWFTENKLFEHFCILLTYNLLPWAWHLVKTFMVIRLVGSEILGRMVFKSPRCHRPVWKSRCHYPLRFYPNVARFLNDVPYCLFPLCKKLETFNDWFRRKCTERSKTQEIVCYIQEFKHSGCKIKQARASSWLPFHVR